MAGHYLKGMRVIEASDFEAKCHQVMEEVARTGEELVITKKGRPMFRLVPFRKKPKSLFGIDKGRIEILGDIITSADVEWDAQTGSTWDGNQCENVRR